MKHILALALAVFVAACVSSGYVQLKTVIDFPENFSGRNVVVEGYLQPFDMGKEKIWVDGLWSAADSNGNAMPITAQENETLLYSVYKINGTLQGISLCQCEVRRLFLDGLVYDWEPYPRQGYLYPQEQCAKSYEDSLAKTEYRCMSGQTKFYFINVSSVEKALRLVFRDVEKAEERNMTARIISGPSVTYEQNGLAVRLQPVVFDNGSFFAENELRVFFDQVPSATGWLEIRFAPLDSKEESSQLKRFKEPFEGQEISYDLRGYEGSYVMEIRDVYKDMPSPGAVFAALIKTDVLTITR